MQSCKFSRPQFDALNRLFVCLNSLYNNLRLFSLVSFSQRFLRIDFVVLRSNNEYHLVRHGRAFIHLFYPNFSMFVALHLFVFQILLSNTSSSSSPRYDSITYRHLQVYIYRFLHIIISCCFLLIHLIVSAFANFLIFLKPIFLATASLSLTNLALFFLGLKM